MKYGIIAAVAVSVLASSCQRKAEGQTVAVVNGEEVTAPDLNFALQLAKVPEGADKTKARNAVLDQLVDRRLLAEQAKKEGIDKSPEYLNRLRRGEEDLLISMLVDRRLNTTQLPSDREIQNYVTFSRNEKGEVIEAVVEMGNRPIKAKKKVDAPAGSGN